VRIFDGELQAKFDQLRKTMREIANSSEATVRCMESTVGSLRELNEVTLKITERLQELTKLRKKQ